MKLSAMRLVAPLPLGSRTAPSRVMFGPHVTNLGDDDRSLTEAHAAYYARRARGGAGVIVVEGASVHPSDWPYERAPLASQCGPGWARIVDAVHAAAPDAPPLVIASLDHAGGQGSSAYSQQALWAPSRVPEVNSREVPKWMEAADVEAVIDGFAAAATAAMAAGCDGVEINAGQHSLVRQFLSGLTNHRDDVWGQDRLAFACEVIARVRAALDAAGSAHGGVLGLRLCVDELAPWAGITPEMAPQIAADLTAAGVDYLVCVRGSIFSAQMTRPDFHEPPGFLIDTTRAVRAEVQVPVFLQGSVVDVGQAEWALQDSSDGVADGVEMTRAQIADPDLVAKIRADQIAQIRPCTRCNQTCQVRDARNPIVTCVAEPRSGYETAEPDIDAAGPTPRPRHVGIIGGGPAGLEAARVAAGQGHRVTLWEASDRLGGAAARSGPHGALVDWWVAEITRLGVQVHLGTRLSGPTDPQLSACDPPLDALIAATGSQPGERLYEIAPGATVIDIAALRAGEVGLPDEGPVALHDPIGGPIAVALAEELGERAVLITPDQIAGNELSRTGDLAPANVRLAQRQVTVQRRSILRRVEPGHVVVEDRFSGVHTEVPAVALVDCGFRHPDPLGAEITPAIGDCVAPRTVLDAVLEARRAIAAL